MTRDDESDEILDPSLQSADAGGEAVPIFPTLDEMAVLLPQYEFHDVLGVGGMGAVYLARQSTLDRRVAVKLLPESASQNPTDAARFITEARSMAKISHAHIVGVHDFGQTAQGHLYLVMEHVNGLDLHRLIHRGEAKLERIRRLVPQLCDALQYAHGLGIVHRDIKPANILITENWDAKIVDFGLAREHGDVAAGEIEYGTPDYVAPERLRVGAEVDHRADIYALGVVIHEMFTGQTPQAAGGAAMQGVPANYASVIKRCMQEEPSKRFQQVADIKTFLTSGAGTVEDQRSAEVAGAPSESVPYVPNVTRFPAESYTQRGGLAKWGWAAALALLLGGGAWFVNSQRELVVEAPVEQPALAAADAPAPATEKPVLPAGQPAETAPAPVPVPPPAPTSIPTVVGPAEGAPAAPATVAMAPTAAVAPMPTPTPTPKGEGASLLGQMTPFEPPVGEANVIKRMAGHTGPPSLVMIHPNQAMAISASSDSTVRFWNLSTGQLMRTLTMPPPFLSATEMALNKDGSRLAVISFSSSEAAIYDVESGELLESVISPEKGIFSCRWSPDEKGVYLLHSHENGGVFYWELGGSRPVVKLEDWPRAAHQLFFGPGPDDMYVFGDNRTVDTATNRFSIGAVEAGIFSLAERRQKGPLPLPWTGSGRVTLSTDGSMLARTIGFITLHKFPSLEMTGCFPAPGAGNGFMGTVFAQDGSFALSGTSSGLLHGCEMKVGGRWFSMEIGRRCGMRALALSQDGRWAVCGGFPRQVNEPRPDELELLVLRIPPLDAWGPGNGGLLSPTEGPGNMSFGSTAISDPAMQARMQLQDLDRHDPELAALQQQIRASHPLLDDRDVRTQLRDLVTKYAAALKRGAVRASPKETLMMNAEAASIEAGGRVPDASTDAATSGDMKRLRGVYRAQLADLDKRRAEAGAIALSTMGVMLKSFGDKRLQAGEAIGAARVEAMQASLSAPAAVETFLAELQEKTAATTAVAANRPDSGTRPAIPAVVSTPVPTAPSTAAAGAAVGRLQRSGRPGKLIKMDRVRKNSYSDSDSSRAMASIPPTLGPVLQIACSAHYAVALLPDGSLQGWGSWLDGRTMFTVPPEVKDVVAVEAESGVAAALLANGSVVSWSSGGGSQVLRMPANVSVTALRKGDYYHLYAVCSDGILRLVSPYGGVENASPPGGLGDVVDIAGDNQSGWFAVKKDGTLFHWGPDSIHIGNSHAAVKDALGVSEGDGFIAVLHKDGTVDGWGEVYEKQRMRVRKYPGALRILDDPAGRVFVVQKPGNEWSVILNPSQSEYSEEDRLGVLEGKLKGCTSAALGYNVILAVKPE